VIVIAIEGGAPDVAVWGGLMAAGAVANGHVGAVLEGGVRDLVEIRRDYGFPVYALDVSPGTTLGRYKTIASQVPVRVGGIIVRPGEMITFFNIHGAMIYLDEAGKTTGYEDVFTKIEMCRRHYGETGLDARYVDQFVR
jgi:hypothetical protein